MARSTVAILKTTPATVIRDYHSVMNLAGYQDVLAKDADTALKVNISWHFFFPGSSTVPVAEAVMFFIDSASVAKIAQRFAMSAESLCWWS